jgi:hypothetical protein
MSTATPSRSRPRRSTGELVVDLLLVVAVAAYLYIAHGYPPDGRQIPMVIGTVGLATAVVQLVGWFVPGLWSLTHGDSPADPRAGRPTAPASPADLPADPRGDLPTDAPGRRGVDVPVVMAWAAGFVAAILLVGYVVAVPVFFLAYFAARRAWRLAVGSAVVMGLVTWLLFESILGIPLPSGQFF